MPTRARSHRPVPATGRRHEPRPRAKTGERGYGSLWQKVRLVKLGQDPLCEDCLARGVTRAATDVDHRVSLRRGGGHYDLENMVSLCHSCHSRKTVRCDGGLGRKPEGA